MPRAIINASERTGYEERVYSYCTAYLLEIVDKLGRTGLRAVWYGPDDILLKLHVSFI